MLTLQQMGDVADGLEFASLDRERTLITASDADRPKIQHDYSRWNAAARHFRLRYQTDLFRTQVAGGTLLATPAALDKIGNHLINECVKRHLQCDWGDLDANDIEANNRHLLVGSRIFSAYATTAGMLWVITDACWNAMDRTVFTTNGPHPVITTALLPDDY